jgi:predicted GNAT family acetyltransferase
MMTYVKESIVSLNIYIFIAVFLMHQISEAIKKEFTRWNLMYFHIWKFSFQKFLEHSDQNKSGDISIGEFIHYVREHEKNLRLQFSHLDKNKDGK